MCGPANKRTGLLVLVLICLSACQVVGPDHETPAMSVPASFSQGGVTWKRAGKTPQSRSWWRLYGDGTLNSLVDRSLANNQELASASARLRQARALSLAARSRYFPGIDIGGGVERSKTRGRDAEQGVNLQSDFEIGGTMSYEVDFWGRLARQVEAARANEDAAAESMKALELVIVGEVAQTYWALRAVDADRALLARAVDLRRQAFVLLEAQKGQGAISGLDLSRAQTELSTAEAERLRLDQERAELVNSLAVLSGSAATGSRVPENEVLPKPPAVPGSVPSELLRQRPDIRGAERRVAAANADIGVATAAFYPAVRIGGTGGLDAVTVGNLFRADSLVWSLGSNVTYPLTGQKLLRYQREAAVALHEASTAEYRQTVLDAMREVENALQALRILAERERVQGQAMESARRTFDLSKQRYDAGLVSFLDLVEAERTRLDSERLLNGVKAERLAVSVAAFKAIGGSW